MGRLNKRQIKRVEYFLKEKRDRREKKELLHNEELPKFIEENIPLIRRLSRKVDQLLIVASFTKPELKPGIIDRLLVLAELENLDAVICLNKFDLVEDKIEALDIEQIYKSIGYKCVITSAKTGHGIEELRTAIGTKKSAFAGHSGVGKSSLLNALNPDIQAKIGEISSWNNKGKHTTTRIDSYFIDENTEILDLPGLKYVDFMDVHRDEARFYFREFLPYADQCKFRDCLHINENHCAVKVAVEQGIISQQRYKSYCNFVESL